MNIAAGLNHSKELRDFFIDVLEMVRHRHIETDRQTDRQTDRHIGSLDT